MLTKRSKFTSFPSFPYTDYNKFMKTKFTHPSIHLTKAMIALFQFISCFCFVCAFSFQVIYQTFDTVFHHRMKHLEVRQKYSAARRIFNSLLGVSSGDETLCRMFDILLKHSSS